VTTARWQSVPSSSRDAWRQVFAAPSAGVDLDAACPVCGEQQLHRYYQVGARLPATASHAGFIARGARWEWCSNCRSYDHASALVPVWWHSDIVPDERRLTALPDALEAALAGRAGGGPGRSLA
jgi:hypothetical protein